MKVAKTPRISTSWLVNILLVLIMLVATGASVAAAPVRRRCKAPKSRRV